MDSSSSTMWETISRISPYLISLFAFWCLKEQINYLRKKSHLPGPAIVIPFLGTVIPLVRDPTRYWFDQARHASSTPLGVSANYIIGKFMVFISSSDLSHQIFSNVRPDAFHLIGHPFGKKLFGEHNMIYLSGQAHKDIRRRIAPNFTPKALSTYAHIQQRVMLNHLISWERLSKSDPIKLRLLVRDMNLDTSQTVFAGPYLDRKARDRFNFDYTLFNVGLMKLPVDFPGFAFRKARLAVERLVSTLAVCASESKNRMEAGVEPTCLIDFWMQDAVREEREPGGAAAVSPPLPSSAEIGGHLFDFLFAAQDASSSSLLWAVTLLDSHPDVLAKVRAEVSGIWSPESGKLITADQVSQMKYTAAVAREVLRYRAPATLVPHIAGEDFALTENYTIPKGAIVFPSVYESSFQGFPEPERFDPDRFLEWRQEDQMYKRNFLVFGAGAHQCVGQRYAINHLVLFLALFTALMDFKRVRTDGCDEIMYVPTICPKDDCMVSICKRVAEYPDLV